jgi:hypothetical protein
LEAGIDSISLNPDTVIKTTMDLAAHEKKISGKGKGATAKKVTKK